MYQPKKHVFADDATRRIISMPADNVQPILFYTGPPRRTESFRRPGAKPMHYIPESKEWETLVKRQPVDTYLPTTPAKKSQPKVTKTHTHRLGFSSSEEMPLIMPPQVLFDAFQDTERTGHLPSELRDGSMPLYMSLNRKFLDHYHHKRTQSTRRVYNKDPNSTALQPGPISQALEANGSRPTITMADGRPARPTSAAEGMFGSPQTDDVIPLSPFSTQELSPGAGDESRLIEPRGGVGVLPEWQIYRSKTKGFPYWYNRITGESRWLPPDQGTSMHKTQSALLASDRSWFSYQPGYYKESQVESTGRSTYDLMVAQQKPDFQLQERARYRRSLQRRIARTQVQEEQTVRWFTSFPPGGATGWSDKLLRVIADKCYEHSGPDFALRTAFFKMDRDKSGYIDIENLKEVLEGWIGFKLSEENMNFLLHKFNCDHRGRIRYEDFISAIDDRLHPLGGTCNLNTGSAENYSKSKEPLVSYHL